VGKLLCYFMLSCMNLFWQIQTPRLQQIIALPNNFVNVEVSNFYINIGVNKSAQSKRHLDILRNFQDTVNCVTLGDFNSANISLNPAMNYSFLNNGKIFGDTVFIQKPYPPMSDTDNPSWSLSSISEFEFQLKARNVLGCTQISFDIRNINISSKLSSGGIFGYLSSLWGGEQSPSKKPYTQATSPKSNISEVRSFPLRCQIASIRTPLLFIGLFFAFVMCFVIRNPSLRKDNALSFLKENH